MPKKMWSRYFSAALTECQDSDLSLLFLMAYNELENPIPREKNFIKLFKQMVRAYEGNYHLNLTEYFKKIFDRFFDRLDLLTVDKAKLDEFQYLMFKLELNGLKQTYRESTTNHRR